MRHWYAVTALLALLLTLGLGHDAFADQAASQSAAPGARPASCPTTTEAENVALARAWHEDVINQRDPAALQAILGPKVVHHAAGGYADVRSTDAVMAMMGDFLAAFSDLRYTFDLFILQDDYVVERYTATGAQDGPLQDLPPSGHEATWTGVNIFRIECGRIVEIWSEVDALSRNQQLTGAATATSEP
jgi:predicted ester cyclase